MIKTLKQMAHKVKYLIKKKVHQINKTQINKSNISVEKLSSKQKIIFKNHCF